MTWNNALPAALYRAEQVRELDRLAIEGCGIPGYVLMNRAGAVSLAALRRRWPTATSIVVVCGAGNNGGDGYVVARMAHEHGLQARVLALSDPANLRGDARQAWQDALDSGIEVVPFEAPELDAADVVIDAILGTGLGRPVGGTWRSAIEAINARPLPVLAIDIPSGLHADSGVVMGVAVKAALTATFIGLKRGLFTGEGPDFCGEIRFDDLAVPAQIYSELVPACWRYDGDDRHEWLARRARTAHKGLFGHVLVIGGDRGFGGAARMAAEAAARCGAGLVSVATRAEHAGVQAAARPEVMFRGVATAAELEPLLARATVIALGPGLGTGEWSQTLWSTALASGLPMILDADALNLLARSPRRGDDWILTPHPGEAGRLLGCSGASVQADRFAAAERLVARYGGTVVLKGAGSLVSNGSTTPILVDAGNPGMASGGMGDVLTGIIASLRAQRLAPLVAARLGAWLHAAAADRAVQSTGERGLLATDLFCPLRALINP